MLQTIADDIWGQPCLAYHVQPSLEPETRAAFEEALAVNPNLESVQETIDALRALLWKQRRDAI